MPKIIKFAIALFFPAMIAAAVHVSLVGPIMAMVSEPWAPFFKWLAQVLSLTPFIWAVGLAAYETGEHDAQDDEYWRATAPNEEKPGS